MEPGYVSKQIELTSLGIHRHAAGAKDHAVGDDGLVDCKAVRIDGLEARTAVQLTDALQPGWGLVGFDDLLETHVERLSDCWQKEVD